jgi:hypothetical protein
LSDPVDSYIKADVDVFLATNGDSVNQALGRRHRAIEALKRKNPSGDVSVEDLSSQDAGKRASAMVNILARNRVSEAEAQTILQSYLPSDPFFVRYYAMQVLASCEPDVAARHSTRIAEVLSQETNDSVRSAALAVVSKLQESDKATVLAELVRTGSPVLGRNAYAVAWSLGPSVGCRVRATVIGLGTASGAEALAQVEGEGGLSAFRLPNAGCSE